MSNHEQDKEPNENPYIEDFWQPAEDRQQHERTREDAEIGITEKFKDEIADEVNVVGRARHEPESSVPLEDLDALPEVPQGDPRQTLGKKIANLLSKFTHRDS